VVVFAAGGILLLGSLIFLGSSIRALLEAGGVTVGCVGPLVAGMLCAMARDGLAATARAAMMIRMRASICVQE
jgi:hypothetical protein